MTEEQARALFVLSGFEIQSLYKLNNEYCPCDDCLKFRPWWLAKTEFGLIKIGWRKRVINIDWSDTPYRSGQSKFWDDRDIPVLTNDDVTKWESGVHAWGYGKAVDYLGTLKLRLQQVAYRPEVNNDGSLG